jgi:hypothetical protein
MNKKKPRAQHRRVERVAGPRTVDAAAAPTPPSVEAEAFYAAALRELEKFGVPFLLGGTYAVSAYTGITRATKDLDIFCKPGDCARILEWSRSLDSELLT